MPKGPVKGTQEKDGRYYLVRAIGSKRKWIPLTRVDEGLPAFYIALGKQLGDVRDDTMPAVVAAWCSDVMSEHSAKTQVDEQRRANVIAESFKEFLAREVETPDCVEFLKPFRVMPRTHDLFRSQLSSVFKFCELKGWRSAGTNPVSVIATIDRSSRTRYITDSELRRIKVACLYGKDGKRTPSGLVMVCFIELAYLTGADVGVVVRILERRDPLQPDEPHVCADGIFLRRDKTENTSAPVIVEWTPRLRAVVLRLQQIKAERNLKRKAQQRVITPALLTKTNGEPLNYEAVSNAWQKAMGRLDGKVPPTMIRDIRAKAATDKDETDGIKGANALLDHTTEAQTADYIRRRKARKTGAVR